MKYLNEKRNIYYTYITYLNYSKKHIAILIGLVNIAFMLNKLQKENVLYLIKWLWAYFQKLSLIILYALIHESKIKKDKTYMTYITRFKIYFAKYYEMCLSTLHKIDYLIFYIFFVWLSRVVENILCSIIEKYCSKFLTFFVSLLSYFMQHDKKFVWSHFILLHLFF